jgi:hypothetical protein
MAGVTRAAPRPSISDQPKAITPRLGLSAVIPAPVPYVNAPSVKTRRRPHRSASLAPVTMNAAMTSAYMAMTVCTPVRVVFRSTTIVEIATFMLTVS